MPATYDRLPEFSIAYKCIRYSGFRLVVLHGVAQTSKIKPHRRAESNWESYFYSAVLVERDSVPLLL